MSTTTTAPLQPLSTEQRRRAQWRTYAAILRRSESPRPGDAEALATLLDALHPGGRLGDDDAIVKADIEAVKIITAATADVAMKKTASEAADEKAAREKHGDDLVDARKECNVAREAWSQARARLRQLHVQNPRLYPDGSPLPMGASVAERGVAGLTHIRFTYPTRHYQQYETIALDTELAEAYVNQGAARILTDKITQVGDEHLTRPAVARKPIRFIREVKDDDGKLVHVRGASVTIDAVEADRFIGEGYATEIQVTHA
jgi:hypothetical protein